MPIRRMGVFRHATIRAGDLVRCVHVAHRDHGAGYARAIIRFADLYGRRQYSIAEIEAQDLLNPAITRSQLDLRQSKQAQLQLQISLNPCEFWPRTENKLEFEQYSREAGLPVPESFGTFDVARNSNGDRAAHRARAAHILARAPAPQLIVKPIDGVYGHGVTRLVADDGMFLCDDGERRTAERVYEWVEQTSDFSSYLVQERVWPHAELAHLSGTDSLQTVRMVTYVATNGSVTIGNCQLRVIVGASLTDNYHGGRTGNLICDIPLASGLVSRCYGSADGGWRLAEVARHPRTGIAFAGFRLPCWDDACRLVRDAAVAFLPLRTIGWDVAITDREPLLIEGNVTWDPAYDGQVGGEILRAILRDQVTRTSGVPLVHAATQ